MSWKVTIATACLIVVCAASLFWWKHASTPVERARAAKPMSAIFARAEEGDPKAQFDLGSAYYYGKGVQQNYAEAVRWYRKAAEQREPRAEDALGYLYLNGQTVPLDYAQALQWYKKGAEDGNAKAQFDLASIYYYGTGVQRDYAEARRWSEKSADQKYAEAQDALGYLYYAGLGVPRDDAVAFIWYRRAAEQGDPKAEVDLAFMYYRGEGVVQNYAEARRWYLKAAKQGNADAQQAVKLLAAQSAVTKLEYFELLAGLPLGFWILASFFVHRGDILAWREAALFLLGLVFLANSGMSLYVIVQGGLLYCSYPVAFHVVRRILIGIGILIMVTVGLTAKKLPSTATP
jgi:TPR repeat protein